MEPVATPCHGHRMRPTDLPRLAPAPALLTETLFEGLVR